jgi:predicted aconitase
VTWQPQSLSDWGALGGIIGRAAGSYWDVPVIEGVTGPPTSDEMKHMGAAMASFGSIPLFHIVGITPEAPTLEACCTPEDLPVTQIGEQDIADFYGAYAARGDKVDVVVFAAPQLSLVEMAQVADLLDGKKVHPRTTLLVATSPQVAPDAERMGLIARIEASGAMVLQGMCFYNSYAREMGEANGWKRLLSNSAKLVNIISGYGYEPTLASMEDCVASAVAGEIV